MTGTRKGGLKTTAKIKQERGSDYYKKLGAKGGKASSGPDYRAGGPKASGFAAMTPEQRREFGRIGGAISRRKKSGKLSDIEQYEATYGDPSMQPNPAML